MGDGHSGDNRVLRGGSWNNIARNVRAAYRNHNSPGNRNANIGFRLAQARRSAGWPASDPTVIPTVRREGHGEHHRGAGVRIGPRRGRERSPAFRLWFAGR